MCENKVTKFCGQSEEPRINRTRSVWLLCLQRAARTICDFMLTLAHVHLFVTLSLYRFLFPVDPLELNTARVRATPNTRNKEIVSRGNRDTS